LRISLDAGAGVRLRSSVQQNGVRLTGMAGEVSRDSHIGGWCDRMDKLVEQFMG
jgi:hypothetical protein